MKYHGGDYSADSSLAAANSAMEAFMRYQAAGDTDPAYMDSLSRMLNTMTGENDRYYPYMKYIDPNTMTSGVEARIHGTALYRKLPARMATGVFQGHNAMTQCSTCHQ